MKIWPLWLGPKNRATIEKVLAYGRACESSQSGNAGRVAALRDVIRELGFNERWQIGEICDAAFREERTDGT